MKIIEKKCPNCGANLEFDVGEKNVRCSSCRRLFAIEYDKEKFQGSDNDLQSKDIRLKVVHKIFSIFFLTWLLITLGFISFFIAVGYGIFTLVKNMDFSFNQNDQFIKEVRRDVFDDDDMFYKNNEDKV